VDRKIKRFNQDENGEWVAELDCGHARHVRHDPPWQNYPWILTSEGRDDRIGALINCGLCDKEADSRPQASDSRKNKKNR